MKPLHPEVEYNVRNQSSRYGVEPSIITLHTTEGYNLPGIRDLVGLGELFDRPGADVSSHIGNDAEGHDARFVPDNRKAWTQAHYNSVSLSIEQIAFAGSPGPARRERWFDEAAHQLANTARWCAHWSILHGIPLRRGWVASGRVGRSGVVFHSQLGTLGGAHSDPGSAYPIQYVLWLARYFRELELGRRGSRRFRRAQQQANRRRRHYGLEPLR